MSYIIDAPTPTPIPFTALTLLSLLRSVVSEWKELGDALGIDDDDIDEIHTGSENDEDCLNEMLEKFVVKYHNWKDVVAALRKIDKQPLAEKIEKQHVLPCEFVILPTCMYFCQFVMHMPVCLVFVFCLILRSCYSYT